MRLPPGPPKHEEAAPGRSHAVWQGKLSGDVAVAGLAPPAGISQAQPGPGG